MKLIDIADLIHPPESIIFYSETEEGLCSGLYHHATGSLMLASSHDSWSTRCDTMPDIQAGILKEAIDNVKMYMIIRNSELLTALAKATHDSMVDKLPDS